MINPFWRNTRTEKHHPDGDPLSTDPPVNNPNPPVARRGCTCEYCGSTLAPSGEVLRMGDKAKEFRRHEDIVDAKDKEITRLNAEIADLKAKLTAANPSPARSSMRVGSLIE